MKNAAADNSSWQKELQLFHIIFFPVFCNFDNIEPWGGFHKSWAHGLKRRAHPKLG